MDYSYIIIPAIVLIITQALKLATDGIKGNFDFRNLFITYGGMPSAHTAFTVSLTTLVGLRQGFDSPIFAVALVFTVLIMRDAVTFRNILGKQAKFLNHLVSSLSNKPSVQFREQMGHSVAEVLAGAGFGIVLTLLLTLV